MASTPCTTPAPSILIVDDDPDIREVIGIILNSSAYDTATAEDGMDALTRLKEGFRPQLIILDMMMPRMNGWAFRVEQKKSPAFADIPVVVLTADGHASEKARAIGAVAYLKKPLEMTDLLSVVARVCPASTPTPPVT